MLGPVCPGLWEQAFNVQTRPKDALNGGILSAPKSRKAPIVSGCQTVSPIGHWRAMVFT
jgi:hypothetical protein